MGVKPRLLDLYCGAGGAAEGYYRAGFDVVGIDVERQPNFPFEFVQGDALDFLRGYMQPRHEASGEQFDAIHASPPCQRYSVATPHARRMVSVVGHGTPSWVREQLGYNPSIADYRAAMGIEWMNRNELSQAIPPAYTEVVGQFLLAELGVAA